METSARLATAADIDDLAALATDAIDEQSEMRGGWVWSRRETRSKPFEPGFQAAIDDPAQGVWVGEISVSTGAAGTGASGDGTATGTATVGYCVAGLDPLRTGEVLGVIHDLYVSDQAREVAVGEKLLAAAVQWCEEQKCVGIDALALPGNRATKNFFESFGFKARLLTVHRPTQ